MKLSEEEIEDFKLEIEELTDLLRNEWKDLNEVISKHFDLDQTLLCGYYEDENNGTEIGVLLIDRKKIVRFEFLNNNLKLTEVENAESIINEFPQVTIALNNY